MEQMRDFLFVRFGVLHTGQASFNVHSAVAAAVPAKVVEEFNLPRWEVRSVQGK